MNEMSNLLSVRINERAQIVEPSFHDGNLTGLRLKENSVVLFLKDEAEREYEMELGGLLRLKVEDFREGNIILHISLLNGPEIDLTGLAEVYGVNLQKEVSHKYFQDLIDELHKRKLVLVSLVSSLGCNLLALCAEVKVFCRG